MEEFLTFNATNVALTLTLDPAIWHTIVHHLSTPTYRPISFRSDENISEVLVNLNKSLADELRGAVKMF